VRLRDHLRPALVSVISLTLLTGFVFPLVLFALGRLFYPDQADGSLVIRNGVVIGSRLIGQDFSRPEYFHTRPSVAVFLGGLMVGRTPEYLGKKIGRAETRLTVLYALLTPAVVLALTSVAIATNAGRAGLVTNSGTRGFTEIIFAYASSMANNGQNNGWPQRQQRVL
jgi:hypothetical protein